MAHAKVVSELLKAASVAKREDLSESTEQAIGHPAGYLARTVLDVHKCESCHNILVNKKASQDWDEVCLEVDEVENEVEERSQYLSNVLNSFTDLSNRGKLIYPSPMAVVLSKDICQVYRFLVKDKGTRYALFACNKPKEAFQNVMATFIEGDDRLANLSCTNSHSFLDKIFRTMAGALFNAFTSNYSKDENSEIHMKWNSDPVPKHK